MTQTSLPLATAATLPWRGLLTRLLPSLTKELEGSPAGTFVARVFRGGARVELAQNAEGRRVLRISRERRPETESAVASWGREIDTFQRHLGITTWQSVPAESTAGIAAAFLEPARESAPGEGASI